MASSLIVLALAACGGEGAKDTAGGADISDSAASNKDNRRAEIDDTVETDVGLEAVSEELSSPSDLREDHAEVSAACGANVEPEPGVVVTATGAVRAKLAQGVWAWKGIPFAAPPLGNLRWRPPEPHDCWDGVLDCDDFGPFCPQINVFTKDKVGAEDCLTLNVWSPEETDEALPVMVFMHGGSNIRGGSGVQTQSGTPLYTGQHLAARETVVVTINYRLGPFGFLALPELTEESEDNVTGNYALLDQLAALEWVQDNIGAFGGDPGRVLVFGESAGAIDICALLASPLAEGLFHAAVMQSGGCNFPQMVEQVLAHSDWVDETTDCGEEEDRLACLRKLSPYKVLDAIPGGGPASPGQGNKRFYAPVVDGWLMPVAAWWSFQEGTHNHVPFIIGTNAEEYETFLTVPIGSKEQYEELVIEWTTPFGEGVAEKYLAAYPADDYETPRKAMVALLTDFVFTCPARRVATLIANSQEEPVYRYYFTRELWTLQGSQPAKHAMELLYVFGSLFDFPGFTPANSDANVSEAMQTYWTTFAANLEPVAETLPQWPAFTSDLDNYMVLDDPPAAQTGLHTDKCDLWESLWDAN